MDWKIIAALVVAVAIVISGFLASGGINFTGTGASPTEPSQNPSAGANPIGDFLTGVKNAVSNPIGDFLSGAKDAVSNLLSGTTPEKNINRTLQVSGSFLMDDNLLKLNSPASSVEIEFNTPASMNVGSEIIQLSDGMITSIGNFSGRLDIYTNNTILIDGNAEAIFLSNVGILPHAQKTMSIKASSSAKAIKIHNISASSLNLNVSGSLDIGQGKASLKAEKESLQIENFIGDLEISGNSLKIEGLSAKALIEGRERVSVGS